MADSRGDAVVVLSAETGPLLANLRAGETAVRSFAQNSGASLDSLKTHADRAANGMGGLSHAFKEFKSEQVQQGRMVGFYVRELAEFTGAGKGAQEVMRGIGAAMAESMSAVGTVGAIFVALEALKAIVITWRAIAEAEEEAIKKGNEYLEKFSKAREAQVKTTASAAEQLALARAANPVERQQVENAIRLAKAQNDLKEAKRAAASIDSSQVGPGQYYKVQAEAKARVLAAQSEIRSVRDLNAAELEAARNKWTEERAKKAKEEADAANARADSLYRSANAMDAWVASLEQEALVLAQHNAAAAAASGKKGEADLFGKGAFFSGGDNPGGALDKANQALSKGLLSDDKGADKLRAEARRQGEAIANAYVAPMVQTFSQGLAQMLQGQASFADMMKSLWQSLVNVITNAFANMLMQTITNAMTQKIVQQTAAMAEISANAGVAGSAAAAGSAMFMGPAAVGVGQATAAAVLAAFMPYASASKGYDVPAWLSPITQLHPREMVLPAEDADVIRGMRGGGGAGQNITIVGLDGPSILRTVESREYQRATRRASRSARRRGQA